MMPVICPTCQMISEKPQAVTPVARLLCMGLFSMFWVGCCRAEARDAPVRLRRVGFGETTIAYWLD